MLLCRKSRLCFKYPTMVSVIIINYNTDISQYWEWSGRGFRPFDDTNEAYKLGVNYLIYGMTH